MSAPSLPADFVLDLHDLAAVILDCHSRIEDKFTNAQLVEVLVDSNDLQTLPPDILPHHEWIVNPGAQKRIAYILRRNSAAIEPVTIDNFAHPDGVKLSPGFQLTRRALEDAFWRCKTFDSGFVLAYAAQSVFDALPPTARLRARTSSGYEIICAPSDMMVMEMDVLVHQACYMAVYEPRHDLGPTKVDMERHLSGFWNPIPWLYLSIGKPVSPDPATDTRVVLDFALAQIGGRGGGNELFALERGIHYHEMVLP